MSAPLPEQYRRSIKKELCYLGGESGGGGGGEFEGNSFENKDRRGLQTFNNDHNFTRDAPAREMST